MALGESRSVLSSIGKSLPCWAQTFPLYGDASSWTLDIASERRDHTLLEHERPLSASLGIS